MQTIVTHDKLVLPKLGLGTWPMLGEECTQAVLSALELGYRHIDTAAAYENEAAVGLALERSPVPRESVHLTTKVWWDRLQPAAMRASLQRSLEALRTDRVDLFMIHWPGKDWDLPRSIETLVALREEGKARHIGVANFPLPLLRRTVEELGAPLSAIQVEYHVLLGQRRLLDYVRQHGMALIAYSPLARNRIAEVAEIRDIAARHQARPAQIALKWLLDQPAVAAIPKAASVANQRINLDAFKVTLNDRERALIDALPKNQRLVSPDFAPRWDPLDE
ncbi:aldo/keto reductase [Azotobacter vinelandii]|uniref:aldo/keto reductase n=1 Tax=Azotobacter vinelandii TaxID=354 RepID=UPI0007749E72|nr:aldo/keto reductase [Azotobacter vinelandii]